MVGGASCGVCVGIGRILGAGRSVRTRMVACLSVLSCSNAWHYKPSMAIGAVFTFLELCLAWSQSLNLCLGEQIVG
jgi:hypothetical protein